MDLLLNTPINSVSFGQVSVSLLSEAFLSNDNVSLFPVGDRVELGAFNHSEELPNFLQKCVEGRFQPFVKEATSLKLWHIMGSEHKIGRKQVLFTFHETNKLTGLEATLLNMQDAVIVCSEYTKDVFESHGVKVPVHVVPLGLDRWFSKKNARYLDDCVTFTLVGKLEKRKNTLEIIRAFAKLYGGNMNFRLHCLVHNPFINVDLQQKMINQALDGLDRTNIIFYPRLNTNSEVNDFINAGDIDLSGLSSAEGWNIPAFTAAALGKIVTVTDNTAHKEWATAENAILVETKGFRPCYDGIHFHEGQPVNQGEFPNVPFDSMIAAIEESVRRYGKNKVNEGGLLLPKKFNYSKTYKKVKEILS